MSTFLYALAFTITASVFVTEADGPIGQKFFLLVVYGTCFFINKFLFRPNLTSDLHVSKADSPKKELYFRGQIFESMEEIDRERKFLMTSGAPKRVAMRRWLFRGVFMAFAILFFSASQSGKLQLTASGFSHLIAAAAFLPIESLGHLFLPLGINFVLTSVVLAQTYDHLSLGGAIYFTSFFLTLGIFRFGVFEQAGKIGDEIIQSLKILLSLALIALVIHLILPSKVPSEKLKAPFHELESAVETTAKQIQKFGRGKAQSLSASSAQTTGRSGIGQPSSQNPNAGNPLGSLGSNDIQQMREQVEQMLGGTGGNLEISEEAASGGDLEELPTGSGEEIDLAKYQENLNALAKQLKDLQQSEGSVESKRAELKNIETALKKMEKQQTHAIQSSVQSQKPGTPQGQSADEQKGGGKSGTQTPAGEPAQSIPEEVASKPEEKFNLDRYWPIFKFFIFVGLAFGMFYLLAPYTQKNDPRKAEEKKLNRQERAELKHLLRQVQRQKYKSVQDEVIQKYHAFLKAMQVIQRGRPEGLPPTEYAHWLSGELPRFRQPIWVMTNSFSDALYGEKDFSQEAMTTFRRSFNEIVSTFQMNG